MGVFVAFFCVLGCVDAVLCRTRPVRLDVRTRLVWRRPYEGGAFEGVGIYQRVGCWLGRTTEARLLLEKDPGETRCGDLALGYLELRDVPGLDRVVIGDFRPGYGQALVFGRQARVFSGDGLVRRRESGSVGYVSAIENAGLRGLFLERVLGMAQFSAFVSCARRDATLDEEDRVLHLRESGLHVTVSERAGANVLAERALGSRLCLRPGRRVRVGVTALGLRFDRPFAADDPGVFRGRRCRNVGLDWDIGDPRLGVFGEIARASPGGYGVLLGAVLRLGRLDTTVLLRRYDRDFWSFYGSGFSAVTNARNERGILAAMTWRTAWRTKISVLFDHHRRPWRTDRIPMPSQGDRVEGRVETALHRRVEIALQVRSRVSPVWALDWGLQDLRRRSVRAEMSWRPEARLRFRGRVERTAFDLERGRERGKGVSLMGDVRVRFRPWLTLDARTTLFDTYAYEARIYEFEGDLPGRMFVALLNGQGFRTYVLVGIKRSRWRISAKYWWQEIFPAGVREYRGALQLDVSL